MKKQENKSKQPKENQPSEQAQEEIEKTAETPDLPTDEAASLEAQLEEKSKQCDELLDKLQRTMAEFDNFRKRTIKEKASMYNDGLRDTIEKLLPILDNFDRALIANKGDGGSFYKGIEMIVRQLQGFLEELGVEVIPGVGQSFDPTIHFAVSHVEDEGYGANEIMEELQKGYKHKDKVIRASMVKVAN